MKDRIVEITLILATTAVVMTALIGLFFGH